MMADPRDTADTVKRLAHDLGFALCGIADADPTSHRQHVLDWLAAGSHGEMAWLENNIELRCDPGELVPGARSVICVADHIGPGRCDPSPSGGGRVGEAGSKADQYHENAPIGDADSLPQPLPEGGEIPGRIARYAQFDDYHKVIKKRLHRLCDAMRRIEPEHTFRAAVDTAPILEREFAHRAGLGWVGKNTLLIHPARGSHLLVGEIVTTLPLAPDAPEPDHCGTCTRCIDACPTDCITPYTVDAARCISYLTIEHRSEIDPELHAAVGDWLFGCDICQDVCPYNAPERAAVDAPPPDEYGGRRAPAMDVLTVLGWSEDDRRAALTRSAMKRAKLAQFKRNALIVAGNALAESHRPALLERVGSIADDPSEDPMVRRTARDVLDRLAGAGGSR